jgi:hypothetical protein
MNSNKTGVWMDFSHAVFVDPYSTDPVFEVLSSLNSAHERKRGEETSKTSFQAGQISNNEFSVHQKEIHDKKHYFKSIADRLKQYDEIFFFGPTDASRLLFMQLQEMPEFKNKKLSWERSDKMTDNQLLARVKKHFFPQEVR